VGYIHTAWVQVDGTSRLCGERWAWGWEWSGVERMKRANPKKTSSVHLMTFEDVTVNGEERVALMNSLRFERRAADKHTSHLSRRGHYMQAHVYLGSAEHRARARTSKQRLMLRLRT
jgi:hypothetical protein